MAGQRKTVQLELTSIVLAVTVALCTAQNNPGRVFEGLGNASVNDGTVFGNSSSLFMNARSCGAACLATRNCSFFGISPSLNQNGPVGSAELGAKCILGNNVLNVRHEPGSTAYIIRSSVEAYPTYPHVRYNTTVTSLDQARGHCISTANGSLPVPYPGPDDLAQLKSLAVAPDHQFYLDMTMIGEIGGNKLFVTGRGDLINAGNAKNDPKQLWQVGEPNYAVPGAHVIMTATGWKTVPVNTTVPYVVCSKEYSPYRLNMFNGGYYKFVRNPLTNLQAMADCARDGGHLALPFATDGAVLAMAPYRYAKAAYGEAWVAGSDIVQEGLWQFPDGTNFMVNTSDTRQLWLSGQPDNFNGVEHWLVANINGSGYWGDLPSRDIDIRPYICELPAKP